MSGSRRPPPPPPEKFSGGFFRQRPKDFLFTDLSDPPTHSLPRAVMTPPSPPQPPHPLVPSPSQQPHPYHHHHFHRHYEGVCALVSVAKTTTKVVWFFLHRKGALSFMAAARAADGAIERTKGVFVYSCKTATLGVFVSVVKTTPKWFGSCEKQQHVGAFGFVKRAAR
ncbi:hypothetical protein Tco_0352455, partial [Tanacetum coccineum]